MVCNNCGRDNPDGVGFCNQCGAPLQSAAYAPPPPLQYGGPQPGYAPAAQPKKKTGLLIGIIVGIVVLLGAAAAVYFLLLSGTPVIGLWYNEDTGVVLEFKDGGTVLNHGLSGSDTADYKYDIHSGTGSIIVGGDTGGFTVEKDVLTVDSEHGGAAFKRAAKDFSTEDFLMGCLRGLWANQDVPEVIELKEGSVAVVHNASGDLTGEYHYDLSKGQGTINMSGTDYSFTAAVAQIDIEGAGAYLKEDKAFDTAAFLTKYGNPLTGKWYHTGGTHGEIDFASDGTMTLTSYGKTFTGTYTFDKSSGEGTVTSEGSSGNFTLSDGTLNVKGQEFKRDYVEQRGAADTYDDIEGIWYDKAGYNGTIEFKTDGTTTMTVFGTEYACAGDYDPLNYTGNITIDVSGSSETSDFSLTDQVLTIGKAVYGRDSVDQQADAVCTTWYDISGKSGTILLNKDETVVYTRYDNKVFNGSYVFLLSKILPDISGDGIITLKDGGKDYMYGIELQSGSIIFDVGNGQKVTYTTKFVEQTGG